MALGIYKKGQGYYTRMVSAIAAGMLILMGGLWLSELFRNTRLGELEPVYLQAGVFVVFVGVLGWLTYALLGRKARVVDFMIATEGEMKKVNWSTRREILGSTWVVIGLTFLIAILIAIFDSVFYQLFELAGVLETGS